MCREQANKGALGDNRGNYLDVLCDEIIIFGAKSYIVKGLQRLGSSTHRQNWKDSTERSESVCILSASNDNTVGITGRHTDESMDLEGFDREKVSLK